MPGADTSRARRRGRRRGDQAPARSGGPERPSRRQARPPGPKRVRGRTRPAEGQQRGTNPAVERAAVTDQMQPPPRPLPVRPNRRRRQPDRRDQVTAGKLGQYPRVDPVSLARQRRQALDVGRVRDLDLPPALLELVMDEPGAVHRLDRCHHRLAQPDDLADQAAQPASIRRCRGHLDRLTCFIHQVHVQAVARQVQPCVHMATGLLVVASLVTTRRLPPVRPLFMAFSQGSAGDDPSLGTISSAMRSSSSRSSWSRCWSMIRSTPTSASCPRRSAASSGVPTIPLIAKRRR
jgi:hypothetical protein